MKSLFWGLMEALTTTPSQRVGGIFQRNDVHSYNEYFVKKQKEMMTITDVKEMEKLLKEINFVKEVEDKEQRQKLKAESRCDELRNAINEACNDRIIWRR